MPRMGSARQTDRHYRHNVKTLTVTDTEMVRVNRPLLPCGFAIVSMNTRLHTVLHINTFPFIHLVPGTFCFALRLGRDAPHWRLIHNETGFIQTHDTPLGYRRCFIVCYTGDQKGGGAEREGWCGWGIIHLSFCLKSQKHPTGIALSSHWSLNIFIIVVYENFFS